MEGNHGNPSIDEWTLGGLILRAVVRSIIDGSSQHRLTVILKRLEPRHMTQTEHVMILAAIQSLWKAKRPLSLKLLEDELALQDPAGFALIVLASVVKNKDVGPKSYAEAEQFVDILVRSRVDSENQAITAALETAHAVLEGRLDAIEGSRRLVDIGRLLPGPQQDAVSIFRRVVLAAWNYPYGRSREHWNQAALGKKDRERDHYETAVSTDVKQACREVTRWLPDLGAD